MWKQAFMSLLRSPWSVAVSGEAQLRCFMHCTSYKHRIALLYFLSQLVFKEMRKTNKHAFHHTASISSVLYSALQIGILICRCFPSEFFLHALIAADEPLVYALERSFHEACSSWLILFH